MTIPGFFAEASLYATGGHYRMAGAAFQAPGQVSLAQLPSPSVCYRLTMTGDEKKTGGRRNEYARICCRILALQNKRALSIGRNVTGS